MAPELLDAQQDFCRFARPVSVTSLPRVEKNLHTFCIHRRVQGWIHGSSSRRRVRRPVRRLVSRRAAWSMSASSPPRLNLPAPTPVDAPAPRASTALSSDHGHTPPDRVQLVERRPGPRRRTGSGVVCGDRVALRQSAGWTLPQPGVRARRSPVPCATALADSGDSCADRSGTFEPAVMPPGTGPAPASRPRHGLRRAARAGARLEPGTIVVFFTDGLVERRDEGLDEDSPGWPKWPRGRPPHFATLSSGSWSTASPMTTSQCSPSSSTSRACPRRRPWTRSSALTGVAH